MTQRVGRIIYTKFRREHSELRECRNCKCAKTDRTAPKRPKPTPSRRRMRPKQPKPMPSGRQMRPKRPNPMLPCCRISPKRSNSDDSGSIWASICAVFRCYSARAIRLAMRSTEPLFLPAGAVLQEVRRLCKKKKIDKHLPKIVSTTLCARAAQRKSDVFVRGRDLASILVAVPGPT